MNTFLCIISTVWVTNFINLINYHVSNVQQYKTTVCISFKSSFFISDDDGNESSSNSFRNVSTQRKKSIKEQKQITLKNKKITEKNFKMFYMLMLVLMALSNAPKKSSCTQNFTNADFINFKNQEKGPNRSGNVVKMLSNKYYVGHFLSNGQIDVWKKTDLSYVQAVDRNNKVTFLDASLLQDEEEYFYAISEQFIIKRYFNRADVQTQFLPTNKLTGERFKGKRIETTKEFMYVMTQDNYILRFFLPLQFTQFTVQFTYSLKFSEIPIGMRGCNQMYPTQEQQQYTEISPDTASNFDYLIVWGQHEQQVTYKCLRNYFTHQGCEQINRKSKNALFMVNDISFSHNCQKTIYSQSQFYQIYIGDNNQGKFKSFTQTDWDVYEFKIAWFMNYQQSSFMILNGDRQILHFERQQDGSNNKLETIVLDKQFEYVHFDFRKEELYLMNDDFISIYKFECSEGLQAASIGKCKEINVIEPEPEPKVQLESELVTKTEPEGSQVELDLQSRPWLEPQTQAELDQNKTEKELKFEPQSEKQGTQAQKNNPQTNAQSRFSQTIQQLSQGIYSLSTFATYVTISLMVLPFSAFFLKFISFWKVCSFYAFVDIKKPAYLQQTLRDIFVSINSSILKLMGIQLNIFLYLNEEKSNEKIPKQIAEKYSITSDIVATNYQNVFMFAISMLILLFLYYISRIQVKVVKAKAKSIQSVLKQPTTITNSAEEEQKSFNVSQKKTDNSGNKQAQLEPAKQNLFTMSTSKLIIGQLISLMPTFFIGLYLFRGGQNSQKNFSQKINLVLVILSIGLSFGFGFLILAFEVEPMTNRQKITQNAMGVKKSKKSLTLSFKEDFSQKTSKTKKTFMKGQKQVLPSSSTKSNFNRNFQKQRNQTVSMELNNTSRSIQIQSNVFFTTRKHQRSDFQSRSQFSIQNQSQPPSSPHSSSKLSSLPVLPIRTKKSITISSLTIFYLVQYNTLTPFTSFLGNVSLFIGFNFLVFGLGMYCAIKEVYSSTFRRVNGILLSLWHMLIHIVFTAMIFAEYDEQVGNYLAVICLFIIFFGAVHEIFVFLFIDIYYDRIYVFLKYVLRNKEPEQEPKLYASTILSIFNNSAVTTKSKQKQLNILDQKIAQGVDYKSTIGDNVNVNEQNKQPGQLPIYTLENQYNNIQASFITQDVFQIKAPETKIIKNSKFNNSTPLNSKTQNYLINLQMKQLKRRTNKQEKKTKFKSIESINTQNAGNRKNKKYDDINNEQEHTNKKKGGKVENQQKIPKQASKIFSIAGKKYFKNIRFHVSK